MPDRAPTADEFARASAALRRDAEVLALSRDVAGRLDRLEARGRDLRERLWRQVFVWALLCAVALALCSALLVALDWVWTAVAIGIGSVASLVAAWTAWRASRDG